MSLVNYKAQNHPQQTGKRGAKDAVDDRGTDPEFFAQMSERFGGFTLDVAASPHNAKCDAYYTISDDGLQESWCPQGPGIRERVWCNPPYSDIRAWVEKAWHEWRFSRPEVIVMLVPANRTEQGWWQDLVEQNRDNGGDFSVEFLRGRMRFVRPDWTPGPKGDRPPFGCCLLIWESRPREVHESRQCRPETCGGIHYDPCADVVDTAEHTHTWVDDFAGAGRLCRVCRHRTTSHQGADMPAERNDPVVQHAADVATSCAECGVTAMFCAKSLGGTCCEVCNHTARIVTILREKREAEAAASHAFAVLGKAVPDEAEQGRLWRDHWRSHLAASCATPPGQDARWR